MNRTPQPSPPLVGVLLLAFLSVAGGAAFVLLAQKMMGKPSGQEPYSNAKTKDRISFACLGNSIQYYNDCPRLLEHMLQTRFTKVQQDSCLRGGASLVSLIDKGNGMTEKFASPAGKREDGTYDIGAPSVQALFGDGTSWDFVIMNDYTQAPARAALREKTIAVLEEKYVPLLKNSTPILLQTAAYRLPEIKGSKDLGDFDEFTQRLEEGYGEYVDFLTSNGIPARLAPVGRAFTWVRHQNRELWGNLYSHDDFHPSPHGTWLEACVLYCTMVQEAPPAYRKSWWETARYMADPPLPLPSEDEAAELRRVACHVCGIKL